LTRLPMLPTSYGENAWWFKFSKYETFKNKKGVYIMPAQNSEQIIYNPYDVGDKLVTDYLNFGKAIFKGIEDTPKINGALSLVKKYGLLGILTSAQYETDKRNSKNPEWTIDLYYDDEEFIGKKTFQEYTYEYFPLLDRQPPLDFNRDPGREFLQYNKNYSERVSWVARKAYELYVNFKNIKDFMNIKEIENLPDIEYMNKIFDCRFKIKNVDLYIHFDELNKASLYWSADNLLKMIDIIYAFKLIDKKLIECKNCGTITPKKRKNSEYCSDSCGNDYRVKKCNYKKKNGLEG